MASERRAEVVSIADTGWAGWREVRFSDGSVRTMPTTELQAVYGVDPFVNVERYELP